MSGLSVVLLDEETLHVDDHPELNVMLVVEGIVHDPVGRRPPERLELRLSSRALTDLSAQIRAVQQAQVVRARARAERERQQDPGQQAEQDERERAAQVATDDARVSTGVLQRVVVALHERDAAPGAVA